jgi:hypothetical protein
LAAVVGLLRFVGLLNAAVWLGVALLLVLGVEPPFASESMQTILGPRNFPYFSLAISQLVAARFFNLYLSCSAVALLHLLAEWLYFGKQPRRFWLSFVLALCVLGLFQSYWLQPRLRLWHQIAYTQPARSEMAGRAFRAWHAVSGGINFILVAALVGYLWRVANPPDEMRFVGTPKFHS